MCNDEDSSLAEMFFPNLKGPVCKIQHHLMVRKHIASDVRPCYFEWLFAHLILLFKILPLPFNHNT